MPDDWNEHDHVAAGTICPMTECGALAVAFGSTNGGARDRSQPWEFTCPSCGIDIQRAQATILILRSDITMKPTPTILSPRRKPNQTTTSIDDLQEQVRRRAYELYEQRGRVDGHEIDHWLQAESEVTQRKAKIVAA